MVNQEYLALRAQREGSRDYLVPRPWWHSPLFHLSAIFLLGASVGFLYRPLESPDWLAVPAPPLLSLWGAWQFPVCLLFGMMVSKTSYVLFMQRYRTSRRRGILASIFLLLYFLLLLCGIAPTDLLQQLHLYRENLALLYPVINPLAVGLAIAFIFEDVNRRSSGPGRAALTGLVAWIGTLTLFLLMITIYHQVVIRKPASCFHWVCHGLDPTISFLHTAPIWIGIGLFAALVGGVIGGWLCHLSLGNQ